MVRLTLSQMDEGFLVNQARELALAKDGFYNEIKALIDAKSPPLKAFIGITNIRFGISASVGACTILALIKNIEETQIESKRWLESSLALLDDNFCLPQTRSFITDPNGFIREMKEIIDDCVPLKTMMAVMSQAYGVEFTIGALSVLELLRRFEENDITEDDEPPTVH